MATQTITLRRNQPSRVTPGHRLVATNIEPGARANLVIIDDRGGGTRNVAIEVGSVVTEGGQTWRVIAIGDDRVEVTSEPSLAAAVPVDLRGATAGGVAYAIGERMHGEPGRGIYSGRARDGARVLVTVTGRQREPHDQAARRMAVEVDGIARLLHIGPIDGGEPYDAMVEAEPAGAPVARLALPMAEPVARRLIARLAAVVAAARERRFLVAHLHPQLIYVQDQGGAPAMTGILPRTYDFTSRAASAASPRPLFDSVFLAPEVLGLGQPHPASGVFLLSAIAAFWLSGEHPFQGDTTAAQAVSIGLGRRRPWRGPAAWRELIERGLAADPSERIALAELRVGVELLSER